MNPSGAQYVWRVHGAIDNVIKVHNNCLTYSNIFHQNILGPVHNVRVAYSNLFREEGLVSARKKGRPTEGKKYM